VKSHYGATRPRMATAALPGGFESRAGPSFPGDDPASSVIHTYVW
jgi:hypothetical protein